MDQDHASTLLDAWMASVNPQHFGRDSMLHTAPELAERTAALHAAAGTMETPAMISVVGTQDVAQQQRELYRIQENMGPNSAEAVEQMLKAPATGLMHVSDLARIANNWNPVLLDKSEANSAAYTAYLNQLVRFPLVTLNYAQRQTLKRSSTDWNELINAVADTFQGIQGQDKQAIVAGLKNLAQAASSTMSTEQKTSLFCQNAINTGNDLYEFYLYSSTCTFREEKRKGFDSKQNDFDVLQIKLTLKMALWNERNVGKIIGQTSESLDDWLEQNTTSLAGTEPIPALQN